jgi:hypothetical protein
MVTHVLTSARARREKGRGIFERNRRGVGVARRGGRRSWLGALPCLAFNSTVTRLRGVSELLLQKASLLLRSYGPSNTRCRRVCRRHNPFSGKRLRSACQLARLCARGDQVVLRVEHQMPSSTPAAQSEL